MRIAFYSNRIQFDGDTLEKKGLGGSESAVINISSNIKKLFPEDEITVYNGNRLDDESYFGVIYKSVNKMYSDIRSIPFDAFISLREISPFNLPFINAKLKCLWSQDDMNEIDLQKLQSQRYARENIDLIFAISEYAKGEIQRGFPEKKIALQRNGFRSDWLGIRDTTATAIYASTPFRGLDVLAKCWNEIYIKCCSKGVTPNLKICTGMSLYQQPEDNFRDMYNYLKNQKGIQFIGALPQKDLYREMQECKVMLYPNHFLETGCMAVLEALANNLWVVTTDLGALGEQVHDGVNGFLIKGDARSEQYQRDFIQLSVDSLCEQLVPNSKGLIFSWEEQSIKMRETIEERI